MLANYADIEISDGIYADIEVDFECVHPGYRATWDDPGEGPEFEITGFRIESVWTDNWFRDATELGDWADILYAATDKVLDNIPDLYEGQLDAWEGNYE
jgi:hypothetical protein